MKEKIWIMITAGSEEEAVRIAQGLLDERLIACANLIGEVRSLYRWKDRICDDREVMLFCKSRRALFTGVCEKVKSMHSYEVPEIVAVPLVEGYPPYLQWIEDVTLSS
jgi:periplasmic divalent cation tolerance protein